MKKMIYLDPAMDKSHLFYGRHLIVQVINSSGMENLQSFLDMMEIMQKDFVNVYPAVVLCGKLSEGGDFPKGSTIISYSLYVPFDWTLPEGWEVQEASELNHQW